MKRLRGIWAILTLSVFFLVSCQEEIVPGLSSHVKAGIPAQMNFKIDVPQGSNVGTRAIYDYETDINSLVLVMYAEPTFQGATPRQMIVNLTDFLDRQKAKPDDGNGDGRMAHVTYSMKAGAVLDKDIDGADILSGKYTVYGIANFDSRFCVNKKTGQPFTANDFKAFSESELKNLIMVNPTGSVRFEGADAIPMTGVTQNVEILPTPADGQLPAGANSVSLSLRRLLSHIKFYIKNGTTGNAATEKPAFVPRKYSVYNLPKNVKLISQADNRIIQQTADDFGNLLNQDVTGADGSIEFFMLENVQDAKHECTEITDRDKWDPKGGDPTKVPSESTLPSQKKFINAPDFGTFLVVYGVYNGATYSGTTSYTIHLGNFTEGKSNPGRAAASYSNFNVNRNEYHKYTVTINGAKSVLLENETDGMEGGTVPGAEGTLVQYDQAASRFVLDSHYETVLIKFNKPDFSNSEFAPIVLVQTPFTDKSKGAYEEYQVDFTDLEKNPDLGIPAGTDINWIHFRAPLKNGDTVNKTELPVYRQDNEKPVSAPCNLRRLLKEIKNGHQNHYAVDTDGTTCYTVAFVDEYFYDKHPKTGGEVIWPDFVNEDNRVLAVVTGKQPSMDFNSFSYKNYIFHISQRSIKTTFPEKYWKLNAFGLETWNETGRVQYFNTENKRENTNFDPTANHKNGWYNTMRMNGVELGGDSTAVNQVNWLDPTLLGKSGYTESIADNLPASHKFSYALADDNLKGPSAIFAYNSCLTRNRDENGNGKIDAGEVKWYLPTHQQYLTIWNGQDYLYGDSQLVDPSKINSITGQDYESYNFYTSSNSNAKFYWAVEGASYGGWYKGSGKTLSQDAENAFYTFDVRCVRNLLPNPSGKFKDSKAKSPVFVSTMKRKDNESVIEVIGASKYRMTTQKTELTGPIANRTERSDANLLPKAFQVAEKNLDIAGDGTPDPFSANDIIALTGLCAEHYKSTAKDNENVEVSGGVWRVPNQRELAIMSQHGFLTEKNISYASCIFCSLPAIRPLPYHYHYDVNSGVMTLGDSAEKANMATSQFHIRCVRDVVSKQQ